jgi:hypothetical protein
VCSRKEREGGPPISHLTVASDAKPDQRSTKIHPKSKRVQADQRLKKKKKKNQTAASGYKGFLASQINRVQAKTKLQQKHKNPKTQKI